LKTNKNDLSRFSIYGNPQQKLDPIQWNYYPVDYEKYITICVDNDYPYWNEVVEMVVPDLYKEKIGIVVLSTERRARLTNCHNLNGIGIRHSAFLLENSLGHFCGQDWSLVVAQNNNVQKYAFFQTLNEEDSFIRSDKGIVELVKPELMSQRIFDTLGLNCKAKIKTLFVGPSYGMGVLEFIPDFELLESPNVPEETIIGVRCDLVENWGFVLKCLQLGLRPSVTCKSLPSKPMSGFLRGINSINLFVDEKTDPRDILDLEALGIKYKLLTENSEDFQTKRNLFDLPNIQVIKYWAKENLDKFELLNYDSRIRSNRLLVSSAGTFLSEYHWKNGFSVDHKKGSLYLDAIEDPDFQKEAELFYYYN